MKPLAPMLTAFAGAATLANAGQARPAGTFVGHQLAGQAKITLAKARSITQKARPGTIVDQELEKEGGGSGLRYSFDVRSGGRTFELGVDARTGRILENGAETAAREAAEAKADARPHRH